MNIKCVYLEELIIMYELKLYDKISEKVFVKKFSSEFMFREYKRRIKYSIRLIILSEIYYDLY